MKYCDLARTTAMDRAHLDAAIAATLDRGQYVLADAVQAFERAWADYVWDEDAIGCASGTDALKLIFRALLDLGRLRRGDGVFTVANTAVATIAALLEVGLVPWYIDVDERGLLDPRALPAFAPQVRAVLPVHLYGQYVSLAPIVDYNADHHIDVLVEDACQAHGVAPGTGVAQFRAAGGRGTRSVVAWSFYPTKDLGALGDGGAVTASCDPELVARVRALREYGWDRRQGVIRRGVGYNSRLDELQAAILLARLAVLGDRVRRRRELRARYEAWLAPHVVGGTHIVAYRTRGREARDHLQRELATADIETRIHYPYPVYHHPGIASAGYMNTLPLPRTEAWCASVLSLPLQPYMTDGDVDRVCAEVRRIEGMRDWTRSDAAVAI